MRLNPPKKYVGVPDKLKKGIKEQKWQQCAAGEEQTITKFDQGHPNRQQHWRHSSVWDDWAWWHWLCPDRTGWIISLGSAALHVDSKTLAHVCCAKSCHGRIQTLVKYQLSLIDFFYTKTGNISVSNEIIILIKCLFVKKTWTYVGVSLLCCCILHVCMIRVVFIFTQISKYTLINFTLCMRMFLHTDYTQIYSYTRLINEVPGVPCVLSFCSWTLDFLICMSVFCLFCHQVYCVTCCGQTQTKTSRVGGRMTGESLSPLGPMWSASFSTATTWISSAEPIRYRCVLLFEKDVKY